jgi:DNA-binding XRE family transcriptional regulator
VNKKHIGGSFFNDVKQWEKEEPTFRKAVNEHIEKQKLAFMLKQIREKENLTQKELAEKANITQSVIARIETGSSRTLPRLDLFNKILGSIGYETSIVARKKGKSLCVALSA